MLDLQELTRAAQRQNGVVSRRQLLALGVSRSAIHRAVLSKLLVTVHCGVYRMASAPVTLELRQRAALLWGGEAAVLSHLSAAWLWKLEGLGRKPPFVIDLSIPTKQILSRVPNIVVHRAKVLEPVRDTGLLGGYACTSLTRTLVDLASVLKDADLEIAYNSAVRRAHENRDAVLAMLKRFDPRTTRSLAKIAQREELGPTQSALETRVRIVLRNANIRCPMPQLIVNDSFGHQIGAFDFAWPESKVIVFADGWEWHRQRDAFEKDRRQISALVAEGWRVLLVTHRRLDTDQAGFLRELVTTLST